MKHPIQTSCHVARVSPAIRHPAFVGSGHRPVSVASLNVHLFCSSIELSSHSHEIKKVVPVTRVTITGLSAVSVLTNH